MIYLINPSGVEAVSSSEHKGNTMAADALAPSVARTSATTVIPVHIKWALAMNTDFNYTSFQYREKLYDMQIHFFFFKTFPHVIKYVSK